MSVVYEPVFDHECLPLCSGDTHITQVFQCHTDAPLDFAVLRTKLSQYGWIPGEPVEVDPSESERARVRAEYGLEIQRLYLVPTIRTSAAIA